MSTPSDISELDLHAYIDGELDADRVRAVEAALAGDTALAAKVAAWRADKAMLKHVYTTPAEIPLPPEWVALARADAPPARARHSWRLVGTIAAALLVVAGGLGIYLNHRPVPKGGDVVATALQVRDDAAEARESVTVASLGEARRYDAALRQIAGADIRVPDLARMGYRVTGLKFYDRAAEILYRDAHGRLFTLYLRPSDGKTRFDQFERRGLRVCVWQDDRISTVMAGNVSAAAMQRLASLTYIGLTA